MAVRKCTSCENLMVEGYVVAGGEEYYCSTPCLNVHYTPEQWDDMYDEDEDDNYYTTWYEENADADDIDLLFNAILGGDYDEVEEIIQYHYEDDQLEIRAGLMDKLYHFMEKENE